MSEQEFRALKERYEETERAASEARGAVRTLRERLRKEFGLESVDQARVQLKKLKQDVESLRGTFESDLERYRKEFGREDK